MPASGELHKQLDALHDKYSNNPEVQRRLARHIEVSIPVVLKNAELSLKETAKRRQELAEGSEQFMVGFLEKNRYFYLGHSELFVHYDGVHFTPCSEDDIQHQILSEITHGGRLRPWKHKVTRSLLKSIRARSPLNSIPESPTIQFVLDLLWPSFFRTRDGAKYFLTVLGDCIRGDDVGVVRDNIYLTPPPLRDLVRAIGVEVFSHLGQSSNLQCMKFKHHDHAYSRCRLLPSRYGEEPVDARAAVVRHSLDVLCVAHHYSSRFGNADAFLEDGCHETSLCNYARHLMNHTPASLVDAFVGAYVQTCPQRRIQMKNMIFIWKKYLLERKLPSVIFLGVLKDMLKERLKYDEKADVFEGVTSPYVPMVAAFLEFWEKVIIDDVQAQDEDLEVDELEILFRHWARDQGASLGNTNPCLLELVYHFYPDVVVEKGKILANLRCTLWNKQDVVRDALHLYLDACPEKDTPTLSKAYAEYVARPSDVRSRTSKQFFEKVSRDILGEDVNKHGVISINPSVSDAILISSD